MTAAQMELFDHPDAREVPTRWSEFDVFPPPGTPGYHTATKVFPVQAILDRLDMTWHPQWHDHQVGDNPNPDWGKCTYLAEMLGITRERVQRAKAHGYLTADRADQWATRLHLHPGEVWPDLWWEMWVDETDDDPELVG